MIIGRWPIKTRRLVSRKSQMNIHASVRRRQPSWRHQLGVNSSTTTPSWRLRDSIRIGSILRRKWPVCNYHNGQCAMVSYTRRAWPKLIAIFVVYEYSCQRSVCSKLTLICIAIVRTSTLMNVTIRRQYITPCWSVTWLWTAEDRASSIAARQHGLVAAALPGPNCTCFDLHVRTVTWCYTIPVKWSIWQCSALNVRSMIFFDTWPRCYLIADRISASSSLSFSWVIHTIYTHNK